MEPTGPAAQRTDDSDGALKPPGSVVNTQYVGRVAIDPSRPNRAFPQIVQEVLDHLTTNADSVEIVLSIRASNQNGFGEEVVRTVTENARTLKFEPGSGFAER